MNHSSPGKATHFLALAASVVIVGAFLWSTLGALAFNGPTQNPPGAAGAISTDASNNVYMGANLNVTGTITSAGGLGGSTISAGNVSAGSFGSNTGGGNYFFSGNVGIGTTASGSLLSVGGAGSVGIGVYASGTNYGVYGATSSTNAGVAGNNSGAGPGVYGNAGTGGGVPADGVYGNSSAIGSAGVWGVGWTYGVYGFGSSNSGVYGVTSSSNAAVYGINSANGPGVSGYGGTGVNGNGVYGLSSGIGAAGVWGVSTSSSGYGVYAVNTGGGIALYANGTTTIMNGTLAVGTTTTNVATLDVAGTVTISNPQGLAGSYLGTSGSNLTVSSTIASSSVSFLFYNATTTKPNSFESVLTTTKKNITNVDCWEYAAATSTMELYYNTTLASSGIQQVVLSSITCGIGGNSTTAFTTSTVPAGAYLFAIVNSTAGTPALTTLDVYATKL